MDNLAHSVIGAALGRAVAGPRLRYPALVGAVAGNVPDLAELVTGDLGRGASYLANHRGITHSVLGAVIEIAVLLGCGWLLRRRLIPRSEVAAGAGAAAPLTSLAPLSLAIVPAVASHLLLDWTGSYGLRPFLPWDETWYYGDVIPIVDPLVWLVPLVALAWGSPRSARWGVGWAVLVVPVSYLLLRHPATTAHMQAIWLAGVGLGLAGWWRRWFGWERTRQAAIAALGVLLVYGAVCAVGHHRALAVARAQAADRLGPRAEAAALTTVGGLFRWELVYATPDSVVGQSYRWIGDRLDGRTWALARNLDRPEVQAALSATPDGRAIAVFARFLAAEIRRDGPHPMVVLRDARYARPGDDGWAVVSVPLTPTASP